MPMRRGVEAAIAADVADDQERQSERRTYSFEPATERNKTSKEDKHMLFIQGPYNSGTTRIGMSDAELDEMIEKAIEYRKGTQ